MMIRTQVYLPQSDINFLKDLARTNKSTMSEEIRKSLEVVRKVRKKPVIKTTNAGQFLLEMAKEAKKIGYKGPKDLATNLDKYLYGSKN